MKKWIAVILTAAFFFHGCSSKSSEELIQEYTKNAEALYKVEDYTGAAGWMNHAIDEAEEEYGKTSVEAAELYLMKSEMAEYAIDALRDIQYAETIYESLNDEEGMVKSYYYYGDYYLRMGDPAQATGYLDKNIECSKDLGDEINEWKYEAYCGKALSETDEIKSIELYKEAEKLFEFIPLEKQNTKAITLYRNIGVCYYNLDMDEEAIKYFTKAIEGYEKEEGLEVVDLEGFKVIKETFEILYDDTPYARQQDFETWYQENINK